VVQAKGRPIQDRGFATPAGTGLPSDCPAGRIPCGPDCVPPGLPCGWDAATTWVDTGAYLSPVFDSLSELTTWDRAWWRADTHGGLTPIAVKWRVGDTPDPSTWLPHRDWFTWTVPLTATCAGEAGNCDDLTCGPPPQRNCACDPNNGYRDEAVFPCVAATFPSLFRTVYPPPAGQAVPGGDVVGEYPLFANGDPAQPLRGRYFQYAVDFTGSYANGRTPPEAGGPFAVADPAARRRFHEAIGPLLKAMRIFYRPARGRVTSLVVAPTQLERWRDVEYETDLSTGGSVQVDVLDEAGVPLFTRVPAGFDLSGLDVTRYPRLRLRATLDNEGDPNRRPALVSWRLNWEVLSKPLVLNRNRLSLGAGDRVKLTVVLFTLKSGTLTVHDAAGEHVRTVHAGGFSAGLNAWTWDGTNERGARVAPGPYFIALRAGDVRATGRIAVVP
jgi:hypothetical protein